MNAAQSVGHQLGKSETVDGIITEIIAKVEPAHGIKPTVSIGQDLIEIMASDWLNQTVDQQFRFSWPLICKLACQAYCNHCTFDEMAEKALWQMLPEVRLG